MKVASIALFTSLIASADAVGFRDLVERVSHKHTESAAAAAETAAAIEGTDQENRDLQQAGCWGNAGRQVSAWHPTYSAGWTNGYCRDTVDCNSPSYSSELACCKAAYAGQMSGTCLMNLPSPPTMSPTQTGGLDVYYPDYGKAWPMGSCTNTRPLPTGRPNYSTMLACCKAAYGGQISGKCLSELPSPPTGSPTTSAFEAAFWYPDYDTAWSIAGCSNKLPLPFNNPNDRPNYGTQVACCKAAYAGQLSGACLSELPSPPTTSPTGTGGAGFWYPDYDKAWSVASCSNDRPVPFNTGDRPTYDTMLACCKGAYGGQISGTCLAALPNPPTTSPSMSGGVLDFYYPDYDTAWSVAGCSNEAPLPYPRRADRPSYDTLDACCTGAFGGQVSGVCVSGFCKTGDNNGFLKFPSWADAAKLEEAFPFSKGGIIMDQKQLDAEFCVEKGVTIVSTGANTLVGVSPFLSTERFAPETITDDEIKAVCFAKCSKNKDCDYISIILSTLAGGDSLCHIYSFAANKPGFKISPFVDEFTTTAIALKKNVNLRDSAEMECDVPGDGNKLVAAILCGAGLGCQPGAESLVTTDLQQLILPALGCIMAGGGGALGCLTCLTREVSQSCVTVAEGICALDSSENFITGACSVDCNIPTPDPAFGGDRCKALMQTAMLCAKGAPRTSFLTIPGEPAFQVGGGCVNSGYDTITPRFTCPIV